MYSRYTVNVAENFTGIAVTPFGIKHGFNYPHAKFVLIGVNDLLRKREVSITPKKHKTNVFTMPKIGDYVVHETHGIGLCSGIEQIVAFGTKKDFDSKKAERFFKERGIKYQFIDMKEKGMSRGEFLSVCQAVGGISNLIDEGGKDRDLLALLKHLSAEDRQEKILENQKVIRVPVVRNKNQATVGYQPDIWKNWE